MISFIDDHYSALGVEPICRLLPIAPSTYYEVVAKRTDVGRLLALDRIDIAMKVEIRQVFHENFQVYRVGNVSLQFSFTRRLLYRSLHCRKAHEKDGASRHHSRQANQNHRIGQVCPVSARPRQQPLQGSRAKHAVVIRFR